MDEYFILVAGIYFLIIGRTVYFNFKKIFRKIAHEFFQYWVEKYQEKHPRTPIRVIKLAISSITGYSP